MQRNNTTRKYLDRDYDTEQNFISYHTQYNLIRKYCTPKDSSSRILEIGIGNKTLSSYLKNHGFNITTCDYDEKLLPDVVSDIRKLNLKDKSFQTIVCFQVLEHIPFKDFGKALDEMKRVSMKRIIISIPYATFNIHGRIKILPFLAPADFLLRLFEFNFIRHEYDGSHYWEMGMKGYSRRSIRKIFSDKKFRIVEEFSSPLVPYHYFFVLE